MLEHYIQGISTFSADIDGVISSITVIVGFWFFLAQAVLIGLCIRFRRREGKSAQYVTGENSRELRWILIPLALIVLCDVYIAVLDGGVWTKVKQDFPEPDRIVRVIGQQWAWTFVHPGQDEKLDTADDVTTIGDLHIEVGKVYHFELTSRDVLHSFAIPVFRLKQDAIPGRKIVGWFEATETGAFDIQCAEICGIGHSLMPGRLVIETPEQHTVWVTESFSTSLAALTLPQVTQE